MTLTKTQLLQHAAKRASQDSFFLGNILGEYMSIHGLDRKRLSKQLSCSDSKLSLLALCRKPMEEDNAFRKEVQRIAEYVGIDALKLAQLIREVQSRRAFQTSDETTYSERGLLLAARDKFSEGQRKLKARQNRGTPKSKRGRK